MTPAATFKQIAEAPSERAETPNQRPERAWPDPSRAGHVCFPARVPDVLSDDVCQTLLARLFLRADVVRDASPST